MLGPSTGPPSLAARELLSLKAGREGCSVERGACDVIRAGVALPDFDSPALAGTGEESLLELRAEFGERCNWRCCPIASPGSEQCISPSCRNQLVKPLSLL